MVLIGIAFYVGLNFGTVLGWWLMQVKIRRWIREAEEKKAHDDTMRRLYG